MRTGTQHLWNLPLIPRTSRVQEQNIYSFDLNAPTSADYEGCSFNNFNPQLSAFKKQHFCRTDSFEAEEDEFDAQANTDKEQVRSNELAWQLGGLFSPLLQPPLRGEAQPKLKLHSKWKSTGVMESCELGWIQRISLRRHRGGGGSCTHILYVRYIILLRKEGRQSRERRSHRKRDEGLRTDTELVGFTDTLDRKCQLLGDRNMWLWEQPVVQQLRTSG